jgi:hemolysin III
VQDAEAAAPTRTIGVGWSEAAPGRPTTEAGPFPSYTRGETAIDLIVHVAGLFVALVSTGWLIARTAPTATALQMASLVIYSLGLLGMLATSTAYHFARPGRIKTLLRRLDHAMIFVMIAASYTPFALNALAPWIGLPLCAVIWTVATLGGGLKLVDANCSERTYLALYLGMGWSAMFFLVTLPGVVQALLLAGGCVYSLGSLVHTRGRMPFQNALWHIMVATGAALHFIALTRLFIATA